jgi:hypothetical protein
MRGLGETGPVWDAESIPPALPSLPLPYCPTRGVRGLPRGWRVPHPWGERSAPRGEVPHPRGERSAPWGEVLHPWVVGYQRVAALRFGVSHE